MISQKLLDQAWSYDFIPKKYISRGRWDDIFILRLDVPWWKFPKYVTVRIGCGADWIQGMEYNITSSPESLEFRQRLLDHFKAKSVTPLNLVK